jgi:hypothetical protein
MDIREGLAVSLSRTTYRSSQRIRTTADGPFFEAAKRDVIFKKELEVFHVESMAGNR